MYPSGKGRRPDRLGGGFNLSFTEGDELSGCERIGGLRLLPVPGQQLVETLGGVLGDAGEGVGEPSLGGDVVHLGGLCRASNYAERPRFSPPFVMICL